MKKGEDMAHTKKNKKIWNFLQIRINSLSLRLDLSQLSKTRLIVDCLLFYILEMCERFNELKSSAKLTVVKCRALQLNSVQYNAGECSTVMPDIQCCIMQDMITQCSAVQCGMGQCSAVQYSAVQYSAVTDSSVQCSTIRDSTVQCDIWRGPGSLAVVA